MKKALVSLNTDLGSSIALRYLNRIANHIKPTLYAVHVVGPGQVGSEPGSGWVQKTWENALIESGKEDLRRFLEMEQVSLPLLRNPKILIGDRTDQLLDEIRDGQYDLFLEGVPLTSNPLDFYTLLKSRLYRSLPCPVMVVKNLAFSERIALLTDENTNSRGFDSCFRDILDPAGIKVDIIDIEALDAKETVINETAPSAPDVSELKKALDQQGVFPNKVRRVHGAPRMMADIFREYGLVISCLGQSLRKNDPLIDLLGHIASPVLICWN